MKGKHIQAADVAVQMAKARVGSLLVFDVAKLSIPSSSQEPLGETDEDAVAGIVTERGVPPSGLLLWTDALQL